MPTLNISRPGEKAEGPLLRHLQHEVAQLLNRGSTVFPGSQPVSFSRKHFQELTSQDYYVCEKSDGFRYLLYCTDDTGEDGVKFEVIYLIDRRNDFFHVTNLHFPKPNAHPTEFHIETLIDGELVIDRTRDGHETAKYLVFDCIVLDGESLMHRTLDKRLAYFKQRIFDPYKKLYKAYPEELKHVPFVIEMKQMQFAYGTEMMFRDILPNLPHGNDGLIFTCRNTPYKHGTDPNILKWKPENENSIDFRLHMEYPWIDRTLNQIEGTDFDSVPVIHLRIGQSNNKPDDYYADLYLEDSEWESMKMEGQPLEDRIAECYLDAQKRWRFMRWRDDKDSPNHISTVTSVIESIRDRVTETELILEASSIKKAWKARASQAK